MSLESNFYDFFNINICFNKLAAFSQAEKEIYDVNSIRGCFGYKKCYLCGKEQQNNCKEYIPFISFNSNANEEDIVEHVIVNSISYQINKILNN